MKNYKGFTEPVRAKVVENFSHFIALDEGEIIEVGKNEYDELLVLASFLDKDNTPLLVVFDEKEEESYVLFASFVENAEAFFDNPNDLNFMFEEE